MLTILSVAAGIAAVTSIHLSAGGAKQKITDLEKSLIGTADLEVVAADSKLFAPDDVLKMLRDDQDVTLAIPELKKKTRVFGNNDAMLGNNGIGLPPDPAAVAQLELVSGRFWSASEEDLEVVLEAGYAKSLNIVLPAPEGMKDTVSVSTPRGPQTFKVVGIVKVHNAQAMTSAEFAYFRLPDMQKFWKAAGKISRIRIELKDGVDAEKVQERLKGILPDIVAVRRPEGFSSFAEETMRSVDLGLLFAELLSVVLGGCTIFNTFLISVGERRRQWSILRAIGATKSQLLRMILWESLAVGFVGSLLGIVLGVGGAYGLSIAISKVLQVTSAPPVWSFDVLAKILLVGLAISVIAALIPAWRATRVSPLEGMRGIINVGNERFPLFAAIIALVIWLMSTAVIAASLSGYLPAQASIVGGVAMMMGFVFWVPPILPAISRVLQRMLSVWRPCETELAVRQTCRNQIRTSLTVAVLIVALANGIGMGHSLLNNVEDVRQWYQRAMLGDVILFPLMPPDATTEVELAKLGNPTIETVNFVTVRVNHESAELIARRLPDQDDKLPWDTGNIPADEVRRKLKAGEVVVSTVLAQRLNVKVGDKINIDNPAGRAADFKIACLVKDYHQGGLTVCLDRDIAQQQVSLEGVAIYLLKWPQGNAAEFRPALDAFANGKLQVNSQEDLKVQLDGMMLGVEAAFWVVLGLGMVVASFATFNTLTMNVLEQTREIGLLRIVGTTRSQVFWTIMSQALIIGLLGVVLGLLAGLTSTYLMHVCSGPLLGRTVDFIWRPGLVAICLGFSLLLGCLAAWIPARRASMLPVLSAIHEE